MDKNLQLVGLRQLCNVENLMESVDTDLGCGFNMIINIAINNTDGGGGVNV